MAAGTAFAISYQWGWVPNGCGQPNIYHQGFRCKVTGATSTAPVAVAKSPAWCEDDASKCTKGAKQMIYWNQLDGNNVQVSGNDISGHPKSPAYNQKLGFADGEPESSCDCSWFFTDDGPGARYLGPQNDIFAPPSQGRPASSKDDSSGAGAGSGAGPQAASSPSSAASALDEPTVTATPSESVLEPTPTHSEPEPTTSVSVSAAHNPTTTARPAFSSIKPPAAGATQIPAPASGGAGAGSGHCHAHSHSRGNGTRSSSTPAAAAAGKRSFVSHHRHPHARRHRGARIDSTTW
ncbi:hypothetical protein C0992_008800 [Termitomyces sp. T32_za158]|nr:hypothetical protein C0992_008800 [Termitomyces sp. T32_za158]